MAVSYAQSASTQGNSVSSLSVAITKSAGTNSLLIARVFTFHPTSAPGVTSVVRGGTENLVEATALRKTFSQASSQWVKGRVSTFYLLDANYGTGSKTVVVTLDGTATFAFVIIDQLLGCYQHEPVDRTLIFSDAATVGPVEQTLLDTSAAGMIVGTWWGLMNGTGTVPLINTFTNLTGTASAVGVLTAYGSDGHLLQHFRSSTQQAGISNLVVGWERNDNGNPLAVDVVFFALEIKPVDFLPITNAIDASAFCPYVSQGQVRKLVDNITGADHLDGEMVAVQADGVPILDSNGDPKLYTVDGGALTEDLADLHAVIHLGLPYTGKVKFLSLADGSPRGTAEFKNRRIFLVSVRVYRSMSFKVGLDENNVDSIQLTTPARPLLTGDYEKLPNTGWGQHENLFIIQDIPAPVFLLALKMESEVEEAD